MIASVSYQVIGQERQARIIKLLAKLRRRQLRLAQQGRFIESALCASRADRVRAWLSDDEAFAAEGGCPSGESQAEVVTC